MGRGILSQSTDQNGFDFLGRPNDSKYHSRERLKIDQFMIKVIFTENLHLL